MKKVLVAVLVSMLVGTVLIGTVDANPFVKAPAISILSPSPWFATCYQNASVPLVIEVDVLETSTSYSPEITSIAYCLDGKENITISNIAKGGEFAAGVDTKGISLIANTTLHDLAEGDHKLKAYSFDINGQIMSAETVFTVDSSYKSPQVTIISPQNKTYKTLHWVRQRQAYTRQRISADELYQTFQDETKRMMSPNQPLFQEISL